MGSCVCSTHSALSDLEFAERDLRRGMPFLLDQPGERPTQAGAGSARRRLFLGGLDETFEDAGGPALVDGGGGGLEAGGQLVSHARGNDPGGGVEQYEVALGAVLPLEHSPRQLGVAGGVASA